MAHHKQSRKFGWRRSRRWTRRRKGGLIDVPMYSAVQHSAQRYLHGDPYEGFWMLSAYIHSSCSRWRSPAQRCWRDVTWCRSALHDPPFFRHRLPSGLSIPSLVCNHHSHLMNSRDKRTTAPWKPWNRNETRDRCACFQRGRLWAASGMRARWCVTCKGSCLSHWPQYVTCQLLNREQGRDESEERKKKSSILIGSMFHIIAMLLSVTLAWGVYYIYTTGGWGAFLTKTPFKESHILPLMRRF